MTEGTKHENKFAPPSDVKSALQMAKKPKKVKMLGATLSGMTFSTKKSAVGDKMYSYAMESLWHLYWKVFRLFALSFLNNLSQ